MKFGLIILSLILIAGCSKQEPAASQDTLLTTPMAPAPAPQPYADSSTGLVVDSSVVRQQPDIERLKSIDPVRVVGIYQAYQPLRNKATTKAQIDAFLRAEKITPDELHSILAEGDRLGWNKMGRR